MAHIRTRYAHIITLRAVTKRDYPRWYVQRYIDYLNERQLAWKAYRAEWHRSMTHDMRTLESDSLGLGAARKPTDFWAPYSMTEFERIRLPWKQENEYKVMRRIIHS